MANEIGSNIKEFRKKQGLSQAELATLLGVSQSAVFYWESGKREPNTKTILNLCDIFKVPLNELYGQNDADMSDLDFAKACEWLEEADYTVEQDKRDEEQGLYQITSSNEGTICRMDKVDIIYCVNSCIERANVHRDQLIIDFIKMTIQNQK